MSSRHAVNMLVIIVGLIIRARGAQALDAERQITLKLDVVGDAPSHLCVIADSVASTKNPGFYELPKSERVALTVDASKPLPEGIRVAEKKLCDQSNAWCQAEHDACDTSFEVNESGMMRCVRNKSANKQAEFRIAVLKIAGRHLVNLELVGTLAHLTVSDLESNKHTSIIVELIGAHYQYASSASLPSTTATRDDVSLRLVPKCGTKKLPHFKEQKAKAYVYIGAHPYTRVYDLATYGKVGDDFSLPILSPGEPVTVSLCEDPSISDPETSSKCEVSYRAEHDGSAHGDLKFLATKLRFTWERNCFVPGKRCPAASIPQTSLICETRPNQDDPTHCKYSCASVDGAPVKLPTSVRFSLAPDAQNLRCCNTASKDTPIACRAPNTRPNGDSQHDPHASEVTDNWTDQLRVADDQLTSFVQPAEQWVALQWPSEFCRGERKVARDRISHVQISDAAGRNYQVAPGALRITVPGLRCGDVFRYTYRGERTFNTEHETLDHRVLRLRKTPDEAVVRRTSLAIDVGAGLRALFNAGDFSQPLLLQAGLQLVNRRSPHVDFETRVSAVYATEPFRLRVVFPNGAEPHRDRYEGLPYLHLALTGNLTYSFEEVLYMGFGVGPALGIPLSRGDSDRVRNAVELATRIVVGYRLTRAFALELAVHALLFGQWIKVEQNQRGLQSRSSRGLQTLYVTLGLRFADLL